MNRLQIFAVVLLLSGSSLAMAQGKAAPKPPGSAPPQRLLPPDPQRPDTPPQPDPGPQNVPEQSPRLADPQRPDGDVTLPASDPHSPSRIQLQLTPAREPVPALKYELLPGPLQRKPGNAATNYYRALLHYQQVFGLLPKEEREKYSEYEEWFNRPLTASSKRDIRKWLDHYRSALAEVQLATYREECKWDLRVQDLKGMENINLLLHDFQNARDLGRLLRLRARLETQEGNLDEAIETTRQGLQLARDMAEPELLINGLIGIANAQMMSEELIEIISQPGSPNLYWAIAALPKPFIDLRRSLRFELDMPERMLPFLKDAETADHSAAEWQRLLLDSITQISSLARNGPANSDWKSRFEATAGLMMIYPAAKEQLAEEGLAKERLDVMPVAQVVAIQASRAQKRFYHDVFKWTLLPYSQQGRRSEEALKQLIGEMGGPQRMHVQDPLFLARLLLPAVQSVTAAEARLQTKLASIQVIEALRMHAAENGGRLPETLDEVQVVPVPIDPSTDRPFRYTLVGDVGHLEVMPATSVLPSGQGKTYYIRIHTK